MTLPIATTPPGTRHAIGLNDHDVTVALRYERLEPDDGTEVLARWTSRFLAGEPAITKRAVGGGRVAYVGAYRTPPLTRALFPRLPQATGIAPLVSDLPASVEVTMREKDAHRLRFLQSTTAEPTDLSKLSAGHELMGDTDCTGRLALEPYGCAAIRFQNSID